jgi:hypothetical protein
VVVEVRVLKHTVRKGPDSWVPLINVRWVWWTWSLQGDGIIKTGRSIGRKQW